MGDNLEISMRKPPDSMAMTKGIETATRAESAKYLLDQFLKIIDACGLSKDSVSQLVGELENYYQQILKMEENDSQVDIWKGDEIRAKFNNFQNVIANKVVEELAKSNAINNPVRFDFKIDENDSLLRGIAYADVNSKMDDATVAKIDVLFIAWMAEHKIISEGGAIYRVDEKGEKLDGEDKFIDPNTFRQLMANSLSGFSQYVQNKCKIQVDVRDRSTIHEQAEKVSTPQDNTREL